MTLTITQPDDWHLHLRDGPATADVVAHSAAQFARALIMPNLTPPVVDVDMALAYRQRIVDVLPAGSRFSPKMSLYLTENTRVDDIIAAAAHPEIISAKLYPAGATTNSDSGVSDVSKLAPVFAAMAEHGLVLCVHGEVVDPDVDIFDREARFVESTLDAIARAEPSLKIVMEHITTRAAAEYLRAARAGIAATVTPQHLLYNRNAMLVGGIRPHFYCLPILKREPHRQALCDLVESGTPRLFLGTDSAPHPKHAKESACGCAGVYSAHGAINFYAEAFEAIGALDKLEAFASFNGADFYGLARNQGRIRLEKQPVDVPEDFAFGADRVVPLRAGEQLTWRVAEVLA